MESTGGTVEATEHMPVMSMDKSTIMEANNE